MYAADCFLGLARATGAPIAARSLRFVARAERAARRVPAAARRNARVRREALRVELRRPRCWSARCARPTRRSRASSRRRSPPARAASRAPARSPRACARALADALPEVLTVAALARALRTSARSLQRQLAGEGTSVAALATELRRSRAEAYLEMGLPIARGQLPGRLRGAERVPPRVQALDGRDARLRTARARGRERK